MGWGIPWFSAGADFSADIDATPDFALSVFRTYFTNGHGVEALGSSWTFLDLTPLGRRETWEDSSAGWPQPPPYQWRRLHDEYDENARGGRGSGGSRASEPSI